jgi:hypothetical protein
MIDKDAAASWLAEQSAPALLIAREIIRRRADLKGRYMNPERREALAREARRDDKPVANS